MFSCDLQAVVSTILITLRIYALIKYVSHPESKNIEWCTLAHSSREKSARVKFVNKYMWQWYILNVEHVVTNILFQLFAWASATAIATSPIVQII